MPDGARTLAERKFGFDFTRVRIHTDERAEDSAAAVNANAYTVANHVVFGRGRFAPGTRAGEKLLMHELAHVRQQHGARIPAELPVDVSQAHEAESRSAAEKVSGSAREPAGGLPDTLPHAPVALFREEGNGERSYSEDCSRYLSAPGIDACEYYRCREANMPDGCGARGYYTGYGLKYCERFSRLLRPVLSDAGKHWLDRTRLCLMQHIERNIPFDAPCADVKRSAFDSHPSCYVRGGICMLPSSDWGKVMGVIDREDNDLKQVILTGISCLANWGLLAIPAHSLAAGGGYRGLMERDRRRAFGF